MLYDVILYDAMVYDVMFYIQIMLYIQGRPTGGIGAQKETSHAT
jgi:hypothetical protein